MHTRFGAWELALAGYNMGYGGLMAAIRKLNSNDFDVLARYESAIPWETTLYVPRIVSLAIVGENPAFFGLGDTARDVAEPLKQVRVRPGTALSVIAARVGVSAQVLLRWNPQYLSQRAPPYAAPGEGTWPVRLGAVADVPTDQPSDPRTPATHVVRHGQTLQEIAEHHGVFRRDLARVNALRPGEALRAGTVLMLPHSRSSRPAVPANKTVVVLPRELRTPIGYKRVFYRVIDGDEVADIAAALSVTTDELRHWNALDLGARVHGGMVLAAIVPDAQQPTAPILSDDEVRVVLLGSNAWLQRLGNRRGRARGLVAVGAGDTWKSVAERLQMSILLLARINHRSIASLCRRAKSSLPIFLGIMDGDRTRHPRRLPCAG